MKKTIAISATIGLITLLIGVFIGARYEGMKAYNLECALESQRLFEWMVFEKCLEEKSTDRIKLNSVGYYGSIPLSIKALRELLNDRGLCESILLIPIDSFDIYYSEHQEIHKTWLDGESAWSDINGDGGRTVSSYKRAMIVNRISTSDPKDNGYVSIAIFRWGQLDDE